MNKHQYGITLIELMISMVLSLGLITGISSLFVQMQKSNKIQRAVSEMTDEGIYVQEVLQKEIRRTAGLRSRSDTSGRLIRIFLGGIEHENMLGSGINFGGSEYIKGDTTIPAPTNDAFVIRYQLLDTQDLSFNDPSNGNSPCTQNILLDLGEDPALQEHVVSVYFYLNGDKLSCTAQREVFESTPSDPPPPIDCVKNCTSLDDFTPLAANTVDLISHVIKLDIKYGVDSDGDTEHGANYYVKAADVPVDLWDSVVSLRLSVVLKSTEDHLTDTFVPYKLDGVEITPTDHHLYKAFTSTIALRNPLLL